MSEYSFRAGVYVKIDSDAYLDRREAVPKLVGNPQDFLIIAGLAGAAMDIASLCEPDPNYYAFAGVMGGTTMMGLGLALAQPKKRVLVMTGDGDLLMNLGSLATVAVMGPPNLSIVCVDNGQYWETGQQQTHTALGTDLAAIAAGAGIAAFYTPTGVGTVVEEGKEKRAFGRREYLMELALQPDYAFVYAHQGDRMGNLSCHKTARNYTPEMAAAAGITIAAVENLVDPGEVDPDTVHVPGIYIQRVVKVDRPEYFPTIE